jgi:transposase
VVNAQHIKAVPGRKTDVKDAEWIGDVLRHGLLRSSFIPPRPQRELREWVRHRSNLVGNRARAVNELHKIWESTNLKLGNVASDLTGVSATAMLKALVDGQTNPVVLAELAKGRLRQKKVQLQQALQGTVRPHHQVIVSQLLTGVDFVEEQIAEVSQAIEERVRDHQEVIDRLDEIPGVNQRVGEVIVAEIGTDMSRFPTEAHLASWAGLCPGNNESAGKRKSSRVRQGNRWLKSTVVEAAQAAVHTKDTYLSALYHRLVPRRGHKRAILAVARTMVGIAYHMIQRGTRYTGLGADYFEKRTALQVLDRLVRRIHKLGYEVSLTPTTQVA